MIDSRNDVSGFDIRSELFLEDEVRRRSTTKSKKDIRRRNIYQRMNGLEIDLHAEIPGQFVKKFNNIFETEIKNTKGIYKTPRRDREEMEEFKRHYHCCAMNTLLKAAAQNDCGRYSRDFHAANAKSKMQIVDCLSHHNYCEIIYSLPGSPKQSRLLPLDRIKALRPRDPWILDPNNRKEFVCVRFPKTDTDLWFDRNHPTAKKYQRYLELVNFTNSTWKILYKPWEVETETFGAPLQLRPVHYAVFNRDQQYKSNSYNCFEYTGGRIYTGCYGHQNIRRKERLTITFEMLPGLVHESIEYDYSCFHSLMAYHETGIDYQGEVYELPGVNPAARDLIKLVINTAVNALNRHETIGSCIKEMKWDKGKNEQGQLIWKSADEIDYAKELANQIRKCGLKHKDRYDLFGQIYDLLLIKHKPIAHYFGSGAGRRLQKIDSEIALEIMYHFAARGIPILGTHDSFTVPKYAAAELRAAMFDFYKARLGYFPKIKLAA